MSRTIADTGFAPSGKGFRSVELGDGNRIPVLIPEPDIVPERPFVGREKLVTHCMAAWLAGHGGALHFRLSGPPGVGKNELVYYLAREVEQKPLFIMHGHEELTPEDVACTARVNPDGRVEYVGSPLLAAMVRGGICFFDEIGKVPSRSLSLLASVLDDRRTLTSVLAGFSVHAHPDFRFCAALNDTDAATNGLPGYIDERLRPAFQMDYPPIEELLAIVSRQQDTTAAVLLRSFREWALLHEATSPREALKIVSFAARLHQQAGAGDLTDDKATELLDLAINAVRGRAA